MNRGQSVVQQIVVLSDVLTNDKSACFTGFRTYQVDEVHDKALEAECGRANLPSQKESAVLLYSKNQLNSKRLLQSLIRYRLSTLQFCSIV